MAAGSDWESPRSESGARLGSVGSGVLRVALLFGSAAVAFALLLTPVLDRETRMARSDGPRGLDRISTGSVASGKTYVLRQSVLQASPNAICVIRENGTRTGDC
jgi:hypothetical protein